MLYKLDDEELATILAALRFYQADLAGAPCARKDIEGIASNEGEFAALDEFAIDDLCERLNGEGEAA